MTDVVWPLAISVHGYIIISVCRCHMEVSRELLPTTIAFRCLLITLSICTNVLKKIATDALNKYAVILQ